MIRALMTESRHDSRPGDARQPRKRLGEILVESGTITASQLERALTEQTLRRQPLGQTLLELGFVTDEVMRRALGSQLGVPYIDLDNVIVDRSLARAIDRDFAVEHLVLPVAQIGPSLTVAMDDPTAAAVIDELARLTGSSVIAVTSSAVAIRRTLKRMYDEGVPAPEGPTVRSRPTGSDESGVSDDMESFRRALADPRRSRLAYGALLGLHETEFAPMHEALGQGLPSDAVDRLVLNTGVPEVRVLEVIGVTPTDWRTRRSTGRLSPEESDRLLRLAHLCSLSLQLFQVDPGLASAWLLSRQPSLDGAEPLGLARTEFGAREVEGAVRRLRFAALA